MKSLLVVLSLAGVLAHCVAEPVSVRIESSADSLVRSLDPDHNYGGAALAVSGSEAVNADGVQMGLIDSFIRFDVSEAVAILNSSFGANRWKITKVELSVVEQGEPNNPIYNRGIGEFEVRWIANDAWEEGVGIPKQPATEGITYDDEAELLDPQVDVPLGTFANISQNGTRTFDLVLADSFVADIRSGGNVSLFLTAASDSIGFQFSSRQNKTEPAPAIEIVAEASWPIPGDANCDCMVNILDLIFIRNRLGQNTNSGDNWQADVNADSMINLLDLLFVRNTLNSRCVE